MKRPRTRRCGLALLAVALTAAGPAGAHPEARITVQFAIGIENRNVSYIGESWTFDTATSSFLVKAADQDGNGTFDTQELKALQKTIAEQTAPSMLFTRIFSGQSEEPRPTPYGFRATVHGGAVTIAFGLGLARPIPPDRLVVKMFDPNLFTAIMPDRDPVTLRGELGRICVPTVARDTPTRDDPAVTVPILLSLRCAP